MILRPSTVKEVKSAWDGVVRMRERMDHIQMMAFAGGLFGGGGAGNALRDVLYNLPLLLAFDVLKQALAAARDENLFNCAARASLGKLMKCGKDSLTWNDWKNLREGVRRRNAVAHDGELFGQKECQKDIASVEAQLIAWEIIDAVAVEAS